jgi:hypothetical protein
MNSEEVVFAGVRRQALQEIERLHPAENAMRGIDIERKGAYARADGALVAAFLAAREGP